MKDFFENIKGDLKIRLTEVYTEMLNLKRHRTALLEQFGAGSAEELIKKIEAGEVEEHPAYENYLAVLSINSEIEPLRERCRAILEEA